jgi:hypothetical protein
MHGLVVMEVKKLIDSFCQRDSYLLVGSPFTSGTYIPRLTDRFAQNFYLLVAVTLYEMCRSHRFHSVLGTLRVSHRRES